MNVEEVSLYFLGGDPIPYIRLVPIDPWSSFYLKYFSSPLSFVGVVGVMHTLDHQLALLVPRPSLPLSP